jgi:AraC-like DNA-binding protein
VAALSDYRELPPRPSLAGALDCIWTQQVGAPRRQRILPDGCVDLIWRAGRDLVVAGPTTRPVHAALPAGTTTVGVRWRPGAGGPGLGFPLDALLDETVAVEQLWGRDAAEALSDRLAEAETTAARLSLLQDVVAARQGIVAEPRAAVSGGSGAGAAHPLGAAGALPADPLAEAGALPADPLAAARALPADPLAAAGALPADPLAVAVANRMADAAPVDVLVAAACRAVAADAAAGRVTAVGPLADALAVSERQLLRRFRAAVGYGPRTLARVLRFQRFLAIAWAPAGDGEDRRRDLALLAAELGFADQAHLTRECRRLAGTTPARLLAGG